MAEKAAPGRRVIKLYLLFGTTLYISTKNNVKNIGINRNLNEVSVDITACKVGACCSRPDTRAFPKTRRTKDATMPITSIMVYRDAIILK